MKLYELLMAYEFDDYGFNDELDEKPKFLTVKINGTYDYLPLHPYDRMVYIKKHWNDVEVNKIALQPQLKGELWALKIYTICEDPYCDADEDENDMEEYEED